MATPSVETAIWIALRARVLTLTMTPTMPIAWPNSSFIPPTVGGKPGPYLHVRHMPNRTERLMISNATHRYQGILQVALMTPLNWDDGLPARTSEQAGIIAAHFPMDMRLVSNGVTVRITKKPDVAQGFRDDDRWLTPVSVQYECFA